jgi:hypothetical protein
LPSQFAYFLIVNQTGKKLEVNGGWANLRGNSIPPPTEAADPCYHAHAAYAVYVQLPPPYQGVFMLWGNGGKIGRRVKNQCVVSSQKTGTFFDDVGFIWGIDSTILPEWATLAVVAVQATSHGWGDCGAFLCYHRAAVTVQVYEGT